MASPSFTIKAPPGTDIWRKPPSTDRFNAPTRPHPTTKSVAPLSTLHSAHVSFRLPTLLTQYDQAGLLISLHPPAGDGGGSGASSSPPKWIKTGVEFYDGRPRAATVACDAWADWSLSPVAPNDDGDGDGGDDGWVTVAVENGRDEMGKSLWVYQVAAGGDKIPLREVCWPFGHGDGWEATVEAYACRPAKDAEGELVVEFRDFEVKWV